MLLLLLKIIFSVNLKSYCLATSIGISPCQPEAVAATRARGGQGGGGMEYQEDRHDQHRLQPVNQHDLEEKKLASRLSTVVVQWTPEEEVPPI